MKKLFLALLIAFPLWAMQREDGAYHPPRTSKKYPKKRRLANFLEIPKELPEKPYRTIGEFLPLAFPNNKVCFTYFDAEKQEISDETSKVFILTEPQNYIYVKNGWEFAVLLKIINEKNWQPSHKESPIADILSTAKFSKDKQIFHNAFIIEAKKRGSAVLSFIHADIEPVYTVTIEVVE